MEECVNDFKSSCMGTRRIKDDNEKDLRTKIDAVYQGIKRSNDISKNVIQITGTVGAAVAVAAGVGALVYTAGGVAITAVIGLAAFVFRNIP